jgi:hypothetical protein
MQIKFLNYNLYDWTSKIMTPSFFMKVLFFLSLFAISFINLSNIERPILDRHKFRQTQTALTSYYIKKDGFKLDYETPVIGKAWSVPMEFPIYQAAVAKFSSNLNIPLDQAGKLISLIFTLLTCFPIFFTLKKLNINRDAIFFVLALFLSSPVYMYWSGTFMIESTALFFSSCYLYYGTLLFLRSWSNYNLILFSLFLLLALLQKVTTALPNLLILLPIILSSLLKINDFKERVAYFLKLILSLMVPVVIAYLWIRYSDLLKEENPIGQMLTSNALSGWNYGSVHQKFSNDLWWKVIFKRNILKSSFTIFGIFFVFFAFFKVRNQKIKKIICASILLFTLPFLIFTNLHIVHEYYQFANSVFWTTCVGLAIFYTCEPYAKKYRLHYFALLASFIISNYVFFEKHYFADKIREISITNNRTLKLSDYLKKHTTENQPIIIYGLDWSSELAYYAERKSLTLPWQRWDIEAIENTEKFLKNDNPSSIVLCPVSNQNEIHKAIRKKYPTISATKIQDCEIYLISTK